MSISNTNLTEWSLGNYEVGFTITPPYTSSSGPQVLYIPKLMPLITQGKPKVTQATLSDSCYINDKPCKPTVAKKISVQNYITVPPQDNRSFSLPVFYPGSRIFVEVRNCNPDKLYVSTKEDNSSLPF